MSRSSRRPIYGVYRSRKITPSSDNFCVDVKCPDLKPAFLALSSYIKETSEVVGTCYNRPGVVSNFIAAIRGTMYMSPKLLIRLWWRQTYPTNLFDVNNLFHRLQIKDLYIAYGYSYEIYSQDPLFKDALGLSLLN